jgi:hypothetical protein
MGPQRTLDAVKLYFNHYAAATCNFEDLAPWCSADRLGEGGCEEFMTHARAIADGLAPSENADEVC